MTKDLTTGKPFAVIVSFLIPVWLGLLLQQLYSVVDTVIVGQFVGADALGGVGSASALHFLIMGSCIGLCEGFCVPVANSFGAGDHSLLRRYVANAIWLCIAAAALLVALAGPNCGQLLRVLQTPEENYIHAYNYLVVIFYGAPLTLLYNLSAGIIRALGDSKAPLLFLAVAAVLNVGLDLVTILVLGMGTDGAAWATVISQGVSGLLCVVYMRKKLSLLRFAPGELQWRGVLARRLLANGIPMGMQYAVTAVGSVILQRAINLLGAAYVNAFAAAGRIHALLVSPLQAMQAAMATYFGQNTGARRLDRIRSGLRVGMVLAVIFCVLYLLPTWLCTPQMSALLLGDVDGQTVDLIRQFLLSVGASAWLLGLLHTYRPCLQGMGYSGLAVFCGVMEMIARVGGAVILVPWLGYVGACMGDTAAPWALSVLYVMPMTYVCLRHLETRLKQEQVGEVL